MELFAGTILLLVAITFTVLPAFIAYRNQLVDKN
jgi:hypothetical protein